METPSVSSSATTAPTTPATAATTRRPPLTKEQRDAIFASAAATMQPARPLPANELLEWKPQIIEYYGKGYSAAQIRDMLQAGNVTTSERMVQRFIVKYSHRKRAAAPRRPVVVAASAATSSNAEVPSARHPAVTGATSARQPAVKASAPSDTPKRT